jgi:hypothetical protein
MIAKQNIRMRQGRIHPFIPRSLRSVYVSTRLVAGVQSGDNAPFEKGAQEAQRGEQAAVGGKKARVPSRSPGLCSFPAQN